MLTNEQKQTLLERWPCSCGAQQHNVNSQADGVFPIRSHLAISEVLMLAATTDEQRELAASIDRRLSLCWYDYSVLARRHWDYATRYWIAETLMNLHPTLAEQFNTYAFFFPDEVVPIVRDDAGLVVYAAYAHDVENEDDDDDYDNDDNDYDNDDDNDDNDYDNDV